MSLVGSAELFAYSNRRYSVRKAGVWSPIKTIEFATSYGAPVAALPTGGVILAWVNWQDNIIETSVYDPDSDSWSAPSVAVANAGHIEDISGLVAGIAGAEVELTYRVPFNNEYRWRHVRLINGAWEIGGYSEDHAFVKAFASSATP